LPTKFLEHSTAVIERNLNHDSIIGDSGHDAASGQLVYGEFHNVG
jgi:hypothetical protein